MKLLSILGALFIFLSFSYKAYSQLSWSGYTAGAIGSDFNVGTAPNNMRAVVTKNNCTQGDGSPKYVSANPGSPCYIAGSLALNAATFTSVTSANNSHYTVTMTFNPGFSGSCNFAQFTIMDINSDESNTTFCDVLEISAIDGNGNQITATTSNLSSPAAGGITTTLVSGANRSVLTGNRLKIIGHNNVNENTSYDGSGFSNYSSATNCGITTVRVKPPDNVALRSITIKYRPAYGTSTSNSYYSFSGPRPATQYISISNITLTSNGSCTILPVELIDFTSKRDYDKIYLNWITASEINNDYFTIERSEDGVNFEEVTKINGNGSTSNKSEYVYELVDKSVGNTYYNLYQTDFDGTKKYLGSQVVWGIPNEKFVIENLYPNPSNSNLNCVISTSDVRTLKFEIMDQLGKTEMIEEIRVIPGENNLKLSVDKLEKGIYLLKVSSKDQEELRRIVVY